MLDDLIPIILIYCIFPLLQDKELRSLFSTCKKLKHRVDKYCLSDKNSIGSLCRRGDLLVIHKRNLIVSGIKSFKIICEKGYINLVRESLKTYKFGETFLNKCLGKAYRGGCINVIQLIIKYMEENRIDIDYIKIFGKACKGNQINIVNSITLTSTASRESVYILRKACQGGHREIIDTIIKKLFKGKTNSLKMDGLKGACRGGHREIVDMMISLCNKNGSNDRTRIICFKYGFRSACRGGRREIVDLMISLLNKELTESEKTKCWEYGFEEACRGGHREIIDLMISFLGHDDPSLWNRGFITACRGGHREIVDLMISLLNNNGLSNDELNGMKNNESENSMEKNELNNKLSGDAWFKGFHHACYKGHYEIVHLLILLIKNNKVDIGEVSNNVEDVWIEGLYRACYGGSLKIAKLIIPLIYTGLKDINVWNRGLSFACAGSHHSLKKLMIDKGAMTCSDCCRGIEDHL